MSIEKDTDRVRITTDGISIPDGDTGASGDLTLMNGHIVCKFATQTTPPWGMPPGGILDISPVTEGQPVLDLINIFDFLPDNWCSWPYTYHRVRTLENGPEKGVVRVERDWSQVQLVTEYTLIQGENILHVATKMTNAGDHELKDIQPGYTLYMKGGYMLTPPGLGGIKEGQANNPLTWSFIGYDQSWCIALHAPYLDSIDHFGQDMFGRISLAPGETKTVQAWIQICAHSNISEVLRFEQDQKGVSCGLLQGRVFDQAGEKVKEPYIVVEKHGNTLTWTQGTDGHYELALPPGEYAVQATAKHYSLSRKETIKIGSAQRTTQDFSGLQSPARVSFHIVDSRDQTPLDARIDILEGPTPVIGFLGQNRYFTDLEAKGRAELTISPGEYTLAVSHGGDFLGLSHVLTMCLKANKEHHLDIGLELLVRPAEHGWYGADMHHHGDILDGVTSPEFVLRSQLACGLDMALLSDHDSTQKNDLMADLARKRRIPFIPAMEISPAWGHFNVYPVNSDLQLGLDPGSSTAGEIFSHARALGAQVIVINHPYSTYGYFRSLDMGVAPGGLVHNFDLIEINYQYPPDQAVQKAWEFWNQGKQIYLTAGTDTHSVWQDTSGAVRMYVYTQHPPTPETYIRALKAGHSFITYGPLIFPEIPFGQQVRIGQGNKQRLVYDITAVHGITDVELISQGEVAERLRLNGTEQSRRIQFVVQAKDNNSWYALVASDARGNRAFTNPLWINIAS